MVDTQTEQEKTSTLDRGQELKKNEGYDTDKGMTPKECEPVIKDISLHLLSRVAFKHWDHVFCSALGVSVKDKCLPDSEKLETALRTRTAWILQELFRPLHMLLTCLSSLPKETEGARLEVVYRAGFPSVRLLLLTQCVLTIHTVWYWVMTKALHFLSSWSVKPFLLVTQGDLKMLLAEVENTVPLVKDLLSENVNQSDLDLVPQETFLVAMITESAANVKLFSERVLKMFSADCRKLASEIFEQTMPLGKHWRINCKTDVPSNPSEYATVAAQSVIGQVMEGIKLLSEDAQIHPLGEVLTAFVEAWMDHILKQRIKFSLQGALQLKQDFDIIRDLIQSQEYGLSSEVKQTLLSLQIFHHMDSAIICLLQQPMSRTYRSSHTWEPFWKCCSSRSRTANFSSNSLSSLDSLDIQATGSRAFPLSDTSAAADLLTRMRTSGTPESYLAANQQEWLRLRVQSGQRWKAPNLPCMSRTPEP
ncbi:coiled-coil domain-containing protein 142 [Protopterus annectens]|uniref:coiled-coil domain-containing protein 142 n=1 Tax=Protopterus annectens TaxID=7888 RepID=UPI001CFA7257|nr:coiled-coil domain-containing protein 142 [Protopterus annectens]